jgi:hypothetical protein
MEAVTRLVKSQQIVILEKVIVKSNHIDFHQQNYKVIGNV